MTREEAIKQLTINRPTAYTELRQALDMAIKALEQEPIIDKICAEIERHRRKTASIDPYDLVGDCLDIIGEYMPESEDKQHE